MEKQQICFVVGIILLVCGGGNNNPPQNSSDIKHYSGLIIVVMNWTVSTQNSYAEAWNLHVTVSVDRTLSEVIKVKRGHKGL